MQDIGISVGDWSANENVNFGGTFFTPKDTRNCDALTLPNWRQCGLSFSEWSKRASANSGLKKKGLTDVQIAKYWKKFQNEVQSRFDSSLFISYALEQNKKEYDASQESNSKNDVEAINDLNLFPPKVEQPTNSVEPNVPSKSDNTKYYIYGGIGLAVIVGAFLIFRKK